jgi:nucleoid-associated protein YgaU
MLMTGERALTLVELQQIDDILTVEAENRRLQSDAVRADREKTSTANRRLQSELDENARLRKELEEARAKLDAIANIERSLNERKPSNEGRPQ